MATPRPIEQPAVMRLIRERRKKLHLSYKSASALAGISDTRWRNLEDGYRVIRGVGQIPENAPPGTLARMAYAVSVSVDELGQFGEAEAAGELDAFTEARAREDSEAQAEAERAVTQIRGLTPAMRKRLEDEVAADIRRIRGDG